MIKVTGNRSHGSFTCQDDDKITRRMNRHVVRRVGLMYFDFCVLRSQTPTAIYSSFDGKRGLHFIKIFQGRQP